MTAGWINPKAPYDFTQGEWKDYKNNYPNLSWSEYRQMKDWDVENRMAKAHNKKYSFIEAYNNPIDPEHYHSAIEPWDFIHANKLDFAQGNVIKYICRYKTKNGIEDLKKAKQYIEMLIDKELNNEGIKK